MRPQTLGVNTSDLDIAKAVTNFSQWYSTFARMLEDRAFTELFNKILTLLYHFEGEPKTRMTDSEIEEQIILCSQHRETVIHLARETAYHVRSFNRSYDYWYAEKYEESKKNILQKQQAEVSSGFRTKGSYGSFTKDDVKNNILLNNKVEYNNWNNHLDRITKTYDFLIDTSNDMKDRTISLQSVAKNRKTL